MKLVLIGGGNFGNYESEPYNLDVIDEKILALAEKSHPRLLFIGFNIRANRIFGALKKHMLEKGVQCEYLNYTEFDNQKTIDCKFKRADIIYLGGGNTIDYMQKIRKFGLDKKLSESVNQNKVMVGLSAGAIILSRFGSSDSRHYKNGNKFTAVKGLGFLDIFLAPHFTNSGREEDMPRIMKNKSKFVAIGLDNLCALAVNGEDFEIVKTNNDVNVYKMYYKNGEFEENKIAIFGKLSDLLAKQ